MTADSPRQPESNTGSIGPWGCDLGHGHLNPHASLTSEKAVSMLQDKQNPECHPTLLRLAELHSP